MPTRRRGSCARRTKDGDSEVVKILDFGIAKTLGVDWSDDESTAAGQLLGTPYCLSPEQAMGNTIDYRADLWSLGVIMFQSFTGRKPFRGSNLTDLLVSICTAPPPKPSEFIECTSELDQWFETALQRDPNARFQSANALYRSFAAAIGLKDLGPAEEPPLPVNAEQPPERQPDRPTQESTQHTAALNVSAPRRSPWGSLAVVGLLSSVLLGFLGWRLATNRGGEAPASPADSTASAVLPTPETPPAPVASSSAVESVPGTAPSASAARGGAAESSLGRGDAGARPAIAASSDRVSAPAPPTRRKPPQKENPFRDNPFR